jgi:hypothetical protein
MLGIFIFSSQVVDRIYFLFEPLDPIPLFEKEGNWEILRTARERKSSSFPHFVKGGVKCARADKSGALPLLIFPAMLSSCGHEG